MANAKVITFCAAGAGVGRHSLMNALAQEWAGAGKHSIVLSKTPAAREVDWRLWITRCQKLSSELLRNYLAGPESYAAFHFAAWPPASLLKEMMSILTRAYSHVLAGADASLSESAGLLDLSDLLLWIATPGDHVSREWDTFRLKLTDMHLPTAFAQLVLNRIPLNERSSYSSFDALDMLMDYPAGGLKRRHEIQRLWSQLDQRQDLYRVRGKASETQMFTAEMIEQIKSQVQPQLLQQLNPSAEKDSAPKADAAMAQKTIEACVAAETAVGGSREERSQLISRVLEDVLGLGPLEPLLKDSDVTEILVNGYRCIYVEKKGKLYASDTTFSSEAQLRTIIDRIVSPIGRRVDESSPFCDARLADGSRVNIVLPPLALDGAVVTIRKFSVKKLDLADLTQFGSMSEAMADFLRQRVVARQNIVVSGGTGSGKTTLLNALSSAIPDNERIVTIEDAAELRLQKPHVVRLESRPANAEGQGAIPIRSLVMNALRMRPDRIVVGECRGGEALDMLQAMNTGHDGSLTTLHANSPRDALGRLETLVLMAGVDLPVRVVREQIRSAVNIIVQQARLPDGSRKVTSIAEVTGMEGDILTLQEIFRYARNRFEETGIPPITPGLEER